MEAIRFVFLLFVVAVVFVRCKPTTGDDALLGSKKLMYGKLRDEIDQLNKQISELKSIYKDAEAEDSIKKAMSDEKLAEDSIEKAMAEDAVKEKKELPSVGDSMKNALDLKIVAEAPAIKAEDVPLQNAAPKPMVTEVKDEEKKKAVSIDDFVNLGLADFTGTDFDEFKDPQSKDETTAIHATDVPHQNGPSHDEPEEYQQNAEIVFPTILKEDPTGVDSAEGKPTHDMLEDALQKYKKEADALSKRNDGPTPQEVDDFFPSTEKSDDAKPGTLEAPSAEERKMIAEEENQDLDAKMDEIEGMEQKEDAKNEFANFNTQLKEVRSDILAIGKDFGGMRNDYLTNPHPLSDDVKGKLTTLKDDFKEIIAQFKEMKNDLPTNADEMNDEEHDSTTPQGHQYTNDEAGMLLNDLKSDLKAVANKMKVVKDAVMDKLEKAEGKKDTPETKPEGRMKGLQEELEDVLSEAQRLKDEVLAQQQNQQKRDESTVGKQMKEIRDLRDEVTAVRTEIKELQDDKNHV